MRTIQLWLLRVCIVFFMLIALFAQAVFLPILAGEVARENPEVAGLQIPFTVLGVLGVACGEAVLVAMWALLSRVRREAIFDPRSLRWVDVIIGAGLVEAGLVGVVVVLHGLFIEGGNLVISLGILSVGLGGIAFSLLMVVMRQLLVSATRLRDEMAEVI